ncbi:MAG: hypothetical protein HY394_04635 [Candidatus Diapherotrites archaeon]|nr:hypothetical protein [Candidatus Diapherotrites archaeon]
MAFMMAEDSTAKGLWPAAAVFGTVMVLGIAIGWLAAFFVQTEGLRAERALSARISGMDVLELPNPDFELGAVPWVAQMDAAVSLSSERAFSGKNSLKVLVKPGSKAYSGAVFGYGVRLAVEPDTVYRFSAHFFVPDGAETGGSLRMGVQVRGEDGCEGQACYAEVVDSAPSVDGGVRGEWVERFVTFRTGSKAKHVFPFVTSPGKGQFGPVFVDSLDLELLGDETRQFAGVAGKTLFDIPNRDFEDGIIPWTVNGGGKILVAENPAFSGRHSMKVVVTGADPLYSGLTMSNVARVSVEPDTNYVFSGRVFIPEGADISGNFKLAFHVLGPDGCGGDKGCHRHSLVKSDLSVDANSQRGAWLEKSAVFTTDADATNFVPFFSSVEPDSSGEFFVDGLGLKKA